VKPGGVARVGSAATRRSTGFADVRTLATARGDNVLIVNMNDWFNRGSPRSPSEGREAAAAEGVTGRTAGSVHDVDAAGRTEGRDGHKRRLTRY
jgi:hypothetical protein